MFPVTHKPNLFRRNFRRHRFLEPRNMFRPHTNRHRRTPQQPILLRQRKRFFNQHFTRLLGVFFHDRFRHKRHALKMQSNFFPARAIFRCCPASHHSRQHFRLLRRFCIKRKRYPQRKSFVVMFFAGNQQPAARDVPRFANFRLLSKRCSPPEPYGKAQTYPRVLTARHRGQSVGSERRVNCTITPFDTKTARTSY